MTLLPIVQRELRVAARKPSTYRTRTLFVIATSVIAGFLILAGNHASGQQMGNVVFPLLFTLAFFYCLAAGVRYTADCLSEEKREGTLGLLFLTDLRGYDVVLGKLISASARTFQGLLAFLPVLAVGLLIGGMTGGEFWRAAAVLTNALFFSVSVGLWTSSMTRQSHTALGVAVGLLLFLSAVPLGIDALLRGLGFDRFAVFSFVSPVAASRILWDVPFRLDPGRFWNALLLNHLLGWLFLAFASRIVPRSWQESPVQAKSSRALPPRAITAPRPHAAKRAALRQRFLDINPIYWLASRNDSSGFLRWTFVALAAYGGVAVLSFAFIFSGSSLGASSILNFGVGVILKVWVAWQACATLAEAQRNGAVELLLATPLRVEEIIHGHWQALKRVFLWPVVAALILSALPLVEHLIREPPTVANLLLFPAPGILLFGMVTLIFDLLALAWVGMWMGLSQPRAIQAFAKTIVFVMIIPGFIFCLPNILFDLFWISWARKKLEGQFRTAAEQRYTPAPQETSWMAVPVLSAPRPPQIRGSGSV